LSLDFIVGATKFSDQTADALNPQRFAWLDTRAMDAVKVLARSHSMSSVPVLIAVVLLIAIIFPNDNSTYGKIWPHLFIKIHRPDSALASYPPGVDDDHSGQSTRRPRRHGAPDKTSYLL
jgi:hypothetical protein